MNLALGDGDVITLAQSAERSLQVAQISLLKTGVQADAVIHALTALKKTPLRHQEMYTTNALRVGGTTNLLAAAREVGARRFVAESMTLGYGYGDWDEKVITEDGPFAPAGSSSQLERHVAAFRSLERQIWEATQAGWIEGISLRYGYFYGPASLVPLLESLRSLRLPLPDGAARSPPGFIWKMRQPPRSQPSNGTRQEKRITSSMTNRCAIKTSSRSCASRLTSRGPCPSQAG